ncbi:MAG TPA: dethiobiotin synthase [Hyphomonadaceae bacterium]|nr:dethiobiotin synthase [Hyphomonadaceae bacterium]
MSGVFVTAIGTDCGKTHVSAALLRELARRGHPALALKPLMSGYSPEKLDQSDSGRLLLAMGRPVTAETVSDICWKSFTEWSAPNVAARRAGVALDYAEMLAWARGKLDTHGGVALVEGAGGVMSPLTDTHTNLDLMEDLRLPALLMVSNYLGAVSHTLTALEVLWSREVDVAAIMVTQSLPNAGLAASMIEELGRWTRLPILEAGFSRGPEDDARWAGPMVERLF